MTSSEMTADAPFDAAAAAYDATFTHTRLGRWLRDAVQRRLAAAFPTGSRVLELACGTGEDAVWLAQQGVHVLATDASSRMVAVTRTKAEGAGVSARITARVLPLEKLDERIGLSLWDSSVPSPQPSAPGPCFDGAYSNFGGLNCVADVRPVGQALARLVRPGGRVILVIMGPWCPWETLWYLAHGQPGLALRRLRRGGAPARIGGQTLQVSYPSPQQVIEAFAPAFASSRLMGIGTLLPPSYLSGLVERWPGLFGRLARWEAATAHRWPWPYLNDHYLLELVRTETRL